MDLTKMIPRGLFGIGSPQQPRQPQQQEIQVNTLAGLNGAPPRPQQQQSLTPASDALFQQEQDRASQQRQQSEQGQEQPVNHLDKWSAQTAAGSPVPAAQTQNEAIDGIKPPSAAPAGFFPFTHADITKALDSASYISNINPEDLNLAMQDPQALGRVLDASIKAAISQALKGTMQLTELGAKKAVSDFEANGLPNYLKDQFIQQEMESANPVLNHPATQKLRGAMIAQFKAENPQATPAQIRKMADDFVIDFAKQTQNTAPSTANQQQQQNANQGKFAPVDYGNLLG